MFRAARVLVGVGLLCSGCNRTQSDDPAEVYQGFVKALQKGEVKVAYAALSAQTRAGLDQRAHRLWELSDGGVKDDPGALFFAQVTRPSPVTEVTVGKREGPVATLRVKSSDRAAEVQMVREGGAWKLDLSENLKP